MLLLVVLVIAGLLGMHTLGGHAKDHTVAVAAEHGPGTTAGIESAHSAHSAHAAAGSVGGSDRGSAGGVASPSLSGDHGSLAGACVLALLGGILLLTAPSRWRLPTPAPTVSFVPSRGAPRPLGLPLHVLCISRT
jgi:hypothetical protein